MKVADLSVQRFPLRGTPDLLDYYEPNTGFYFEHAGEGVVGVGTAVRIDVEPGDDQVARAASTAKRALREIPGAIVVGALPFSSSDPATLIVPQIAIARRDGVTQMIVTGREGLPEPETMPHEPPPEPWDSLVVEPETDPREYVAAVADARARIRRGELDKVVLARTVIARSDHRFEVPALLEQLRRVEPDAYVFGVRGFLGASPELLIAKRGDGVRSRPLAGTAARDRATAADLLASEKDRAEHAIVVDAMRAALSGSLRSLHVDEEPHVIATSRLWHLATDIAGTSDAGALELAALLHPTPAVCGTPRDVARAAIAALEPVPRGLYAGLVGWMDADGDGEWAVALRCAEIDGERARLFAGSGIVADSDPESELQETDAKMRALLDALGYA